MDLNIHSLIPGSRVNGPGNRMVIWTQGCKKACRGCFNPETWKYSDQGGYDVIELADHVLSVVKASGLEGLTLTGGDPLEQPHALLSFFEALESRNSGLSLFPRGVILFTGYTMAEIELLGGVEGVAARKCLTHCDVVVDGRYEESLRVKNILAGSSNQVFSFSSMPGRGLSRISEFEVKSDQAVEVHSGLDGCIQVTGFPQLLNQVKRLRELGLIPVVE